MVCLNHPDVNATAKCAACGKPLCKECIMIFDNQKYCSETCYYKGLASGMRAEQVISAKRRTDRSSSAGKFFTLIIIVIIAVAAACFYVKNTKAVDTRAAAGIESIKTRAGIAVEQGKKAVPQNSKYKQSRENLVNEK